MSGTTRRELIKLSSATVAALSTGGTALYSSQLPGQPSHQTPGSGGTMPSSIMAIAAHPGDTFFAMGAPVALAAHNGGAGFLLSLTLGDRGSPTIPPEQYKIIQRDAADKAAALMGATALFLTYRDGELPANEEATLAVCDLLRRHKPATVVTHWKGSWHKDHRACYEIVQNAIFYAGLASMERELPAHQVSQLFFADNWEDTDAFVADTYLDISPVFEQYCKACSAFPMWRGENGFRYNDYYSSRAVECGALSQCQYAVSLMSQPDQRIRNLKML